MTDAEYEGGTYAFSEEADAVGRDTLYEVVSEQTQEAGNLNVDKVALDSDNMDEINAVLQSGGTLDASVDSGVLRGNKESFEAADHAIGIDEPAFDENGDIIGYMIRDTGGSGKEFASRDELENAGLFKNEQILISKNEVHENEETFGERVRNMSLDDLNAERERLIELGVLDDIKE